MTSVVWTWTCWSRWPALRVSFLDVGRPAIRDLRPRAGGLWERLPLPEENIIAISVGLIAQRARPLSSPRIFRKLGLALLVAGIALNVAAIRDRGPGSIDEPTRLVTAGVHARTRNPMYLGWSAIHIGIGLAARSPWVLFTWPVAAVFIHRSVRAEEEFLAREFGSAYETYREMVPRYLL